MDDILTSGEVAKWIRISESTLCRWRQRGIGPHAIWMAPTCPRYRRSDVEKWLEQTVA
jgi:predicted DNA-binding transcriptional regulator AlpA